MRLPRLFRTNVFRLTLAYMALFALSVGALSAFIYSATLGYLDTQTNAIIEAEINGLLEQYDTLDWARRMRQEGCTRIHGFGESLGAAVLIQAAALEPAFAAIVAECPFAELRQIGAYRVGQMGLPRLAATR